MEKANIPHRRGRVSKKLVLIVSVIAVVIIALVVGLAVGLTRGGGSGEDESGSQPTLPTNTSLGNYSAPSWRPQAKTSWQIVLQNAIAAPEGPVTPDVEVFDIDLFTNPESTIQALHDLDKKVICYFSAGSYEPYRPDSDEFQDADLGSTMDGWPDEKWLDIRTSNVRRIMAARIALAAQKGCDGIDPDNVDGYSNSNGVGLTEEDTIDFLRFMSRYALSYGLAMGLKNAGSIVQKVLDFTEFSVNEQCVEYSECSTFALFIDQGKPVFHIEYPDDVRTMSRMASEEFCSNQGDAQGSAGFSTVLKTMDLNGFVRYCDGMTVTTEMSTS